MTTKKKEEGAAVESPDSDNAAAPATEAKVEVAKVEDEVKKEIESLKSAIEAQKAKGEITAASESTLQALYEELKAARADLAALKELGAREVPVATITNKWAKWLPW